MGLSVMAYERIEKVSAPPRLDDGEIDFERVDELELVYAFCHDGFEQSLRGLEPDTWYAPAGEEFSFAPGSYTGYGVFRNALARAAVGVSAEAV